MPRTAIRLASFIRAAFPVLGLAATASLPTAVFAAAPAARLLIGTYTANRSEGIYLYDFDTETGRLDAQPRQIVKAENPSWLTFSADRQYVYAINENGPGQRDPVGRVTSYRIDQGDGTLQEINRAL